MKENFETSAPTRKRKADDDTLTNTAKYQLLNAAVEDFQPNLPIVDEVIEETMDMYQPEQQQNGEEEVFNKYIEPIHTRTNPVVHDHRPFVQNCNNGDVNYIDNKEQNIGQKTPSLIDEKHEDDLQMKTRYDDEEGHLLPSGGAGIDAKSMDRIEKTQTEAEKQVRNISAEPLRNLTDTESTPVESNVEPGVKNSDVNVENDIMNKDKNTVRNETNGDFYSFFEPSLTDVDESNILQQEENQQEQEEAECTGCNLCGEPFGFCVHTRPAQKNESIAGNNLISAFEDENVTKDVIVDMEIDVDKEVEIYTETDSFDHNEEDTASLAGESYEDDLFEVMEEEDLLLQSGEQQQLEEARDELDEFLRGDNLVQHGPMEGDIPQDQENEPDLPVGAKEGQEGSVTNGTPTSTVVASTPATSTSGVEMVDIRQLYDLTKGQVEQQHVCKMKQQSFEELVKLFCGTTATDDNDDSKNEELEDQEGGEDQDEEGSETATYELELVLRMVRTPKNPKDEVFICSWRGGWNLSACTQISLSDLQGSEFLVQQYWNYERTVNKIIDSYATTQTPAKRQKLELLSEYYGRFLDDVHWAREKGNPARFEKLFEMWAWVEKAREWNDVNRDAFPDQDHYPLYLEYFHSGAKIPIFQFIVKNEYSKAALNTMNRVNEKALRNTSCTCSCDSGACAGCREKMIDHEPCQLKGNRIEGIHDQGLDSRTFEAVICAPGQCSHSTPCSPPKREVSLMVAWRPDVKGVGLYATCRIPRHTVLCEYVGEVITERKANGQAHSYQYSVPRTGLVIEAMHKGNESRFVNHSCDPNLALLVLHEGSVDTVPRLFFVSRKDISQGDELQIDYHPSYTFQKIKERPVNSSDCFCHTKLCRQFV